METEIHELPVDGSRSLEYQYEYLSVTYCWHRRYAGKRGEARSSLFGKGGSSSSTPRPTLRGSVLILSLYPPLPRGLPFHWQPLLRKSSPFGFKWGLVHTMPRVIYPLGTRGSSTRQTSRRKGDDDVVIRPLTLSTLSLSAFLSPPRSIPF